MTKWSDLIKQDMELGCNWRRTRAGEVHGFGLVLTVEIILGLNMELGTP